VLEYRNWQSDEKNYKPSTVNNRLAAIHSYIKYALARDVSLAQVALNVLKVPPLKIPKQIRSTLDVDQLSALMNSPKNTRLGIRDRAILVILFDTAMRCGELILLNLRDISIDENNPYVRLKGKGDKDRHVGLSEKSIPVIRQYIEEFHSDMNPNKPFIYTVIHGSVGRMSERNVERIISKYGKIFRSEMDLPDSIYPHMFRASRATGLYQDGVPIEVIASMLGHADINTTRDHYARPSLEQLRKAMEKGTAVEPEEQASWPIDEEKLAAEIGLVCRRH
jgi:site-specific recombinase XerD